MARPLRIEFPGAWYWISNRALPGRSIFHNEWDYGAFLELLDEVHQRFQLRIHAYCLLSDEYHLLVSTQYPNLAESMRYLQSSYTQRWNRDWNGEGPIFRGRYNATVFQADTYLLPLSANLHQLPIQHGLVKDMCHYTWCSAAAHSGMTPQCDFLYLDDVRSRLPDDCADYRQYYESYHRRALATVLESKRRPVILGDQAYKQQIAMYYKGNTATLPGWDCLRESACLEQVLSSVSAVLKVNRKALYEGRRGQLNIPRMMAIYLSHRRARLSLNELADHFGMNHYSSASSAMQRYQKLRATQQDILHLEHEVLRCLSE